MADEPAGPLGSGDAVSAGTPAVGRVAPSGDDSDWTVEIVHRIDTVVGTVRDKTTVPITKIARIVVFGVVVAVAAVAALVLLILAVVRLLDVYLPFHPLARRVWVTYAGLGAIFALAGAFAWRKRKPARS